MGLRCELCDAWLSPFQLSKLCDTCYKTRTIVKAYSAEAILKNLEDNFLIRAVVEEVVVDTELKKPNGYKNIKATEAVTKPAEDHKDYTGARPARNLGNKK